MDEVYLIQKSLYSALIFSHCSYPTAVDGLSEGLDQKASRSYRTTSVDGVVRFAAFERARSEAKF
jgi:hypothetical protein